MDLRNPNILHAMAALRREVEQPGLDGARLYRESRVGETDRAGASSLDPRCRRAASALDDAGFSLVVEAGLGRGYRDFRTMRLHTLPGSRRSADMCKSSPTGEDLTSKTAYQRLLADGALDRCGITLLAGKAVGAPFVGAVAATLAVTQVLRLLHGGQLDQLVDLDLQSVDHRGVIPQSHDFSSINPGYLRVR